MVSLKCKRILTLILCVLLSVTMLSVTACKGGGDSGSGSGGTLLIGTGEFNGIFVYQFGNSAYDAHISDLVHGYVYDTGQGGELVDGVCLYQKPEIKTDDKGGQYTVYTFKLRDGVKYSDGTPVTVDDLVFSWKLLAAPAYDGPAPLYTYGIRGVNEYRYDDPNYEAAVARIDKEAEKVSPEELKEAANEMAVADFEDPDYGPDGLIGDLGLKIDSGLDPKSDEYKDAVIAAATDAYATDYADMFEPDIINSHKTEMTTKYVADNMAGGEKVPDISGIEIIDESTIQVTADGVDPTLETALGGVNIMSEKYYGEGVTKVDFSKLIEKYTQPMGCGRYIFDKFENNVVTLHANPDYYGGEPNIKNLKLQGLPISDTLTAAVSGTCDVVEDVSCSPDNVKKCEEANKYCMTVDNNGFGYVGISAKKLPDINLRKGLCYLMNRDLGVKTYYGEYATVLERPITQASWGYPKGDDARVYDYDINKAKEMFKAAGCTEKDGKMLDAKGKVLHFDAYIVDQDHPVVPLFNQMKVDLEAMGAEFAIQQIDWTSYNEMYSNGDLMLWAAAYGDGPPDPDPYQYFHSDMIKSQQNPFHLNDKKVDELIMKGRTMLDPDERQPIYDELFDKVMETATIMPYYQRMNMFVINPDKVDIESLNPNPDAFYGFYQTIGDLKLAGA